MSITKHNKGKIIEEIDIPLLTKFLRFVKQYPDELLHIPNMSMALAAANIDALKEGDIKVQQVKDADNLIENAVLHNLNGLLGKSTMARPIILSSVLRSISYVLARMKHMKVLTVGPRTEAEIFMLTSAGFDPANIRGLDLMSYSPRIDVGDMHDMPYPDDSFDLVILGWVLAYSKNPIQAVREARRVAKKDAVFAVGCEYSPYEFEERKDRGSILADDVAPYEKLDDILKLFEGDVGTIWFKDDIRPEVRHERGSVVTVFQRKLSDNPE